MVPAGNPKDQDSAAKIQKTFASNEEGLGRGDANDPTDDMAVP